MTETTEHDPSVINQNIVYKLEKIIGEGTYGIVYRAHQEGLDRPVAIKTFKNKSMDKKKLRQEAWIQGQLAHSNIISVYHYDEVAGRIIIEYMPRDLHGMLIDISKRREWITVDKAIRIIRSCLEALAYAHDNGVVHGDIKTKNILISDDLSRVKLSDFGVSRSLFTSPTEEPGSEGWASPETLRGWKEQKIWTGDYTSDLWSLGVVSYLLLTGKHPFVDDTGLCKASDLIMDASYNVKPLGDIKPALGKFSSVILKLLEREKSKRYQSAHQVLEELLEEPMIACKNCSELNKTTAKYCNSCGNALGQMLVQPIATTAVARTAAEWASLAFTLNSNRDYAEAEKACNRAIEQDSHFANAYQTRGFARSNMGKLQDAIDDFTKALELTNPSEYYKRAQIHYHRGFAYMKLKKQKESCEDAATALELDPTNKKYEWLVGITCDRDDSDWNG